MQKVTVLCVGKLKERFYTEAAGEYAMRLSRFCQLEITELSETRLPDNPSQAQIDEALRREAEVLLQRLPSNACLIALCVEGKPMSSEALAEFVARQAAGPQSHLVFIIGGSHGLHPCVKQRAQLRLSMSPMTFPHHLARVMLLEQVYRSYQILAGSRYHK